MQAIVVFDLGSSSLRCTLFDDKTLDVVAHASKDRRSVLFDGSVDTIGLLDDIDELLDQVFSSSNDCIVLALGFSSFSMNLVGVDADGTPVAGATMSYASRSDASRADLVDLRKKLGADALKDLYQGTGTPFHTSYAASHLRTITTDHVVTWQTVASLVVSRWSGKASLPITYGEASWTGLLNIHTCEYEPKLLELLPNPKALPAVVPPSKELVSWEEDSIAGSFFKRWPALQHAKIYGGIPDGIGANLGSKCTGSDRIAVTVGTSAAARVIVKGNVTIPAGLFGYRIDESHMLLGGALSDGGSVIEWVTKLLNLGDVNSEEFQLCMKEAETRVREFYTEEAPSVQQLSMVPFLSGERSTGFRDSATGTIFGLTRETTRSDFILSCMEGVILRLNAIIQLIRSVAPDAACIVISGKALETNALWRKMLADCTRLPVIFDDTTREGTSRGIAKLISPSYDSFEEEDLVVTSCTDPENSRRYWDVAAARQNTLIQAMFSASDEQ